MTEAGRLLNITMNIVGSLLLDDVHLQRKVQAKHCFSPFQVHLENYLKIQNVLHDGFQDNLNGVVCSVVILAVFFLGKL